MDPLDGVQAKLDRAFEHGHALREEIRVLLKEEFYGTSQIPSPKLDAKGVLRCEGYFHVLKQPPPKLGVIAGDLAHNLRSALDHLIYQLALLDSGGRPEGTFFPIARSNVEYRVPRSGEVASLRDRALAGVGEDHRTLVDAEQPFVGRTRHEADGTMLAMLNAFSNTDKHRVIQPTALRPFRVEAFPVTGVFDIQVRLPKKMPQVIADGAHIYSLFISNPADPFADMRVQTNFVYGVGFGNRGLTDADLLNMCLDVGRLIDRFRPVFA
jgi:hypothetical protein